MRLLFDIETDEIPEGPDIGVTTVHSLVIQDLDDPDRVLSCTDASKDYPPIRHGLALLRQAEIVYGHNVIAFDIPVLEELLGWVLPDGVRVIDTLVLARARYAHIRDIDFHLSRKGRLPPQLIGRHSLEAWGYRLGVRKQEFDGPWDVWSKQMQDYCEGDLSTNRALLNHLRKHSAGLPKQAVEMELDLRGFLVQQQRNGWPLDLPAVHDLVGELSERKHVLEERLIEAYGFWVVPNGKVVTPKRSRTMRKGFKVPQHYYEGCPYQKIKIEEFRPGSRAHISRALKEFHGWEPEEFTNETSKLMRGVEEWENVPKIDETILKGLEDEVEGAQDIIDYLTITKRLGQISEGNKSWLACVTEESKSARKLGIPMIHHRCNQNRARTHRAGHSNPNVAQVPKSSSPWGKECRACWTVPPGWKMIGVDIAGLELRMLGHHMAKYDGGEYAEQVISGDPHGLVCKALFPGTQETDDDWDLKRDCSKTFTYATLYGAGDEKRGKILVKYGLETAEGEKALRALGSEYLTRMEENLGGFRELTGDVESMVRETNRVILLDGRYAYPSAIYAALNTLLQGDGALAAKYWIRRYAAVLTQKYGGQGWDGKWAALGWIHDETQTAALPDIAQEAAEIMVEQIALAGEELGCRVPLTGDYAIGNNWKETH